MTTIERYMLNRDLDMKDTLVNPNYVQSKINALVTIPGEIGFTVRMGLTVCKSSFRNNPSI
jgi:hypothetical protein